MLAIIIPFYKLTFFDATLQSLMNQTDKRFKVYIGDDASSEDPNSLLEKYKGQFEFFYHRFESNLGSISLTKQWERCINLSTDEEWIMILGDDDVLGHNVVEEFYKNLELIAKNMSNVIRYATILIDGDGKAISKVFQHPIYEKVTDSFFRKQINVTRSSLSEYIFRRSAYQDCKFSNFPLAWYADDMAWLDFSKNKPIYTINESLIYFRFSNQNISGKVDNLKLKETATFLFYKVLVYSKLNQFDAEQTRILLTKFEILLKKRKQFSLQYKIFLLRQYLKLKNKIFLWNFVKRQIKSSIKS